MLIGLCDCGWSGVGPKRIGELGGLWGLTRIICRETTGTSLFAVCCCSRVAHTARPRSTGHILCVVSNALVNTLE